VQPCDEMVIFSFFLVMEHRWNENGRGKPKYWGEKTCPSANLSTTNLTWTDRGSNPSLRGERLVTNRLSHGTAITTFYNILYIAPFFVPCLWCIYSTTYVKSLQQITTQCKILRQIPNHTMPIQAEQITTSGNKLNLSQHTFYIL
jgi:hypothetical protein